jgi:outer membrane translocation and assembly module TamA
MMRFIRILIFCFVFHSSIAQQEISYVNEVWWGVMTSAQVSDRLAVWNDAHFVNELFFIYRTGLTYHPKRDNLVITVGYGFLKLGTPISEGSLIRPEHRPWMQTTYRVPSTKKLSTSFRFRYDARFIQNLEAGNLTDGFSFNHRWRFNNALRYAWGNVISKNTRFTTTMLNEALFRTGPGPNGVRHEHRTHFLGQLGKGNFVYSLGYVIRYINTSPTVARINHGPVIWVTINLNLIKGKQLPTFIEYPSDHVD